MKALYGLRLESKGHEMKLAFLDKSTCMKWASAMRQPPTKVKDSELLACLDSATLLTPHMMCSALNDFHLM